MKRSILTFACLVAGILLSPVLNSAQSARSSEAELIRLERAKWGDPPGALTVDALKALMADDFISVEYGADIPPTGVQRKTRELVFSGPPLPPAKFELSEWHAVYPNPDVVILSYRVTGVSFPWKAYATSVWARRGGKWYTVFYQASTAR